MDFQRFKMKQSDQVNGTHTASYPLWQGIFDFDRHEQRRWFEENWSISLYFVAAYVIFIYTAQEFMKNRKPMDLKKPMIVWNSALALFSITGCFRLLPEFFGIINGKDGFYKSVCASCQEVTDQGLYWGWLFTLSKIAELIDTVFIVLRKRKLIFLHWYHHSTVLLYCWYSYSDEISPARWFICVNYSIHAMMYTYYALRSLNVHVPKKVAMTITTLQLSQMVVGVVVNVYAYLMKMRNVECDVSMYHLHLGLGMYASYFVLFAHFFNTAYLKNKKRLSQGSTRATDNNNALRFDPNSNVMQSTQTKTVKAE